MSLITSNTDRNIFYLLKLIFFHQKEEMVLEILLLLSLVED